MRESDQSAEPQMARQLLVGWRWFDDRLRASLAEAGFGEITTAQSMLFPYLDADGTRPSVLASRLGITKQAVRQLVADLEKQGLLETKPDPASSRSKLIYLTPEGQEAVVVAMASLDALERELDNRLGAERTSELRTLLLDAWP